MAFRLGINQNTRLTQNMAITLPEPLFKLDRFQVKEASQTFSESIDWAVANSQLERNPFSRAGAAVHCSRTH